MSKFSGSLKKYPARATFLWYLGLIVVGSSLLTLPICRHSGRDPISLVEAVFTATSACCVTGLAVRSTEHDFNFAGQAVLLILIQLGGIGIMTATTFFTLYRKGGHESLRQRATMTETLGALPSENVNQLLRRVLFVTFLCEGIGFLLLLVRFLPQSWAKDGCPWYESIWAALFHSVSAFCNAGFALADDSMTSYRDDVLINLTIILLIIVGGIGFPVLTDVYRNIRQPGWDRWYKLGLHAKLVLIGTAALLFVGTVAFLLMEWNNTLKDMPMGESLLVSMFQSATARTAGFNTVALNQLTNATLFVMILLMIVGAAPCSTGGGFKVSTFMILVCHAVTKLRGTKKVRIFRRTIPDELVGRSIASVLLFVVIGTVGLGLLLMMGQSHAPHDETKGVFLQALFETVSALATVGLTMDYTTTLNSAEKCLIIVLMFIGRLGPITLVLVLARETRDQGLEYPKGDVLVG